MADNDDGGVGSDSSSVDSNLIIYTAEEIELAGLQVAGYTEGRINRVKKAESNTARFKDRFGIHPLSVAALWEELLTTEINEARVEGSQREIKYLLRAILFLRHYGTEGDREAAFDKSKKTIRKWTWFFVSKIAALKDAKVVFPDDSPDIWIMRVDGVQCKIAEPTHPKKSRDRKYGSYKFKRAGVNFEIGLALHKSKCVWLNGPFPAGEPDHVTFVEGGLLQSIPAGKKLIADGVYKHFPCVSAPNRLDDPWVARFKRRARMRHERYNGMLKIFKCLDNARFIHGEDKFKVCFTAVVVLTDFEMELVSPLFDILVDGSGELDKEEAALAAADAYSDLGSDSDLSDDDDDD